MSYPTVNRRLPVYAGEEWQARLTAACATRAKLGPASLVLFDVSTLLCRHRHNNVYADHWVMPMSGAPLQVKALRIVRQAGSGKSQGAIRRARRSRLPGGGARRLPSRRVSQHQLKVANALWNATYPAKFRPTVSTADCSGSG